MTKHTYIQLSKEDGEALAKELQADYEARAAHLTELGCKSYEGVITVSKDVVMGFRDGKD